MQRSSRRQASPQALLEARLGVVRQPESYLPHEPHPKQRRFLALTTLEGLYGGAAGGGKTDALLMAAAQYVHVPGYAALLLRRTYTDLALPEAIMDRAKTWWMARPEVHWDDKDKRFTFPSGATITFGYLDNERDKFRYQGAELQFIGFDELTQFPEGWYRYLLSRLRRKVGQDVPLRARGASNPGGIGHDWVLHRFVDGNDPKAPFVPATLEDNPHLDQLSYSESLERLDPITRKQLREGIWVRDGGGLVYGAFSESLSLIDEAPEGVEWDFVMLGLDFGIVDENALTVVAWRAHDPTIYVLESYRFKGDVQDMADEVLRLNERYTFTQIVGDVGGLGKAFAEEIVSRRHVPVDPAEKNNKLGYVRLLNSDLAKGRIKVIAPQCADLVQEWKTLPWNDARTKEAEGFDNHASDSMLYVWRACNAYSEEPEKAAPVVGTPEYYQAQEAAILARLEQSAQDKQRAQWWE